MTSTEGTKNIQEVNPANLETTKNNEPAIDIQDAESEDYFDNMNQLYKSEAHPNMGRGTVALASRNSKSLLKKPSFNPTTRASLSLFQQKLPVGGQSPNYL